MIYILHGEDQTRQEYKLETIKRRENCDQIDRFDCQKDDPDLIENALESFSLFAQKPMVILDHASFLSAKNDTKLELERIAPRMAEDKVVVCILNAKKLDSRKKLVKQLQSTAAIINCMPLDDKSLPGEVQNMMKERHIKMDQRGFQYFCANVGYSSTVIASQLDKLALYSSDLKYEDVKALTTVEPTQDVFKMTNALFEKNRVQLLELYRNFRAQNMEPNAIIGLLAGQIRFVYQVRVLMDEGYRKEAIMQELNASSGRIWNTMRNASNFSANQLLENLAMLSHLDQAIKSGRVDRDTAFENFILRINDNDTDGHTFSGGLY